MSSHTKTASFLTKNSVCPCKSIGNCTIFQIRNAGLSTHFLLSRITLVQKNEDDLISIAKLARRMLL
ncbi:hypothetical protein DXM25_08600 [Agrobacterium rosae]|nr:hypothetical protein DXM25_08600 [Agrobacterium rosae]MQB48216.1 hypothetical protein [Agrobacterium rosae]